MRDIGEVNRAHHLEEFEHALHFDQLGIHRTRSLLTLARRLLADLAATLDLDLELRDASRSHSHRFLRVFVRYADERLERRELAISRIDDQLVLKGILWAYRDFREL